MRERLPYAHFDRGNRVVFGFRSDDFFAEFRKQFIVVAVEAAMSLAALCRTQSCYDGSCSLGWLWK